MNVIQNVEFAFSIPQASG